MDFHALRNRFVEVTNAAVEKDFALRERTLATNVNDVFILQGLGNHRNQHSRNLIL